MRIVYQYANYGTEYNKTDEANYNHRVKIIHYCTKKKHQCNEYTNWNTYAYKLVVGIFSVMQICFYAKISSNHENNKQEKCAIPCDFLFT